MKNVKPSPGGAEQGAESVAWWVGVASHGWGQ